MVEVTGGETEHDQEGRFEGCHRYIRGSECPSEHMKAFLVVEV